MCTYLFLGTGGVGLQQAGMVGLKFIWNFTCQPVYAAFSRGRQGKFLLNFKPTIPACCDPTPHPVQNFYVFGWDTPFGIRAVDENTFFYHGIGSLL